MTTETLKLAYSHAVLATATEVAAMRDEETVTFLKGCVNDKHPDGLTPTEQRCREAHILRALALLPAEVKFRKNFSSHNAVKATATSLVSIIQALIDAAPPVEPTPTPVEEMEAAVAEATTELAAELTTLASDDGPVEPEPVIETPKKKRSKKSV